MSVLPVDGSGCVDVDAVPTDFAGFLVVQDGNIEIGTRQTVGPDQGCGTGRDAGGRPAGGGRPLRHIPRLRHRGGRRDHVGVRRSGWCWSARRNTFRPAVPAPRVTAGSSRPIPPLRSSPPPRWRSRTVTQGGGVEGGVGRTADVAGDDPELGRAGSPAPPVGLPDHGHVPLRGGRRTCGRVGGSGLGGRQWRVVHVGHSAAPSRPGGDRRLDPRQSAPVAGPGADSALVADLVSDVRGLVASLRAEAGTDDL